MVIVGGKTTTVKLEGEMPVPPAVVAEIAPVVAPLGTVAEMEVSLSIV